MKSVTHSRTERQGSSAPRTSRGDPRRPPRNQQVEQEVAQGQPQHDLRNQINNNRDCRNIITNRQLERQELANRDLSDCFPAFTQSLITRDIPKDFKPTNIPKYDGKQDPRRWLRCNSVAIEVCGGSNSTKAIYFPMALEPAPLAWLETLRPNSIESWEALKQAFVDNFQGSMIPAGTRHDLSQVRQEENETLRSYTRRFFDIRATIANIADEEVIRCFRHGLATKTMYREFGRNLPTTVLELRDMMQRWADQEDEENERFPKRKNDKGGGPGRPDRSNYNNSGASRKRKPENQVANVETSHRNKKSGKLHDDYEKILHKKCPMHPNGKHTLFQCTVLRKSLNAPPPDDQGKDKEKEDEGDDKIGPPGFQKALNTVNVIFGGDDGIMTKRAQKLFRREVLSVEPAVPRPLRHSEVPISFSRDDQWTSFSEPGKLPLVLDPVVAGSTLTRVLIDGGSGLNLLFPSTLKRMRMDIGKMLTPSKAPFYGKVPGNAATPIGSVTLPVTFGTADNFRTEYIKFEVANFESSYHAILGIPALAKFMAVPHYVYLVLKMPGTNGILSLRGDVEKSYDCDQEAIKNAASARVPEPSSEVLAAAQQLADMELEVANKKPNSSRVKPNPDVGLKSVQLQEGDASKTALIGGNLDSK